MRTIYYKEAPENPESLKVILKDYFEKKSPATYWSDTDELQCYHNKHRSPDDLLLLANHYFQGTTIKEVINAYKSINVDYNKTYRTLVLSYCGDIQKPRLRKELQYMENFIGKTLSGGFILTDGYYSPNLKEKSQWTLGELTEMIDD